MKTRSVASKAATSASPSSTVIASGFSSSTCLPASRAASTVGRWAGVGRQISIAAIESSPITRSRSSVNVVPELVGQVLGATAAVGVDRGDLHIVPPVIGAGMRAPHESCPEHRNPCFRHLSLS